MLSKSIVIFGLLASASASFTESSSAEQSLEEVTIFAGQKQFAAITESSEPSEKEEESERIPAAYLESINDYQQHLEETNAKQELPQQEETSLEANEPEKEFPSEAPVQQPLQSEEIPQSQTENIEKSYVIVPLVEEESHLEETIQNKEEIQGDNSGVPENSTSPKGKEPINESGETVSANCKFDGELIIIIPGGKTSPKRYRRGVIRNESLAPKRTIARIALPSISITIAIVVAAVAYLAANGGWERFITPEQQQWIIENSPQLPSFEEFRACLPSISPLDLLNRVSDSLPNVPSVSALVDNFMNSTSDALQKAMQSDVEGSSRSLGTYYQSATGFFTSLATSTSTYANVGKTALGAAIGQVYNYLTYLPIENADNLTNLSIEDAAAQDGTGLVSETD